MVNCSDCLSAEFIGHTSVPYNKTGKHFDFINENRTSSDVLRPIFPKMFIKSLIKSGFVFTKGTLELYRVF